MARAAEPLNTVDKAKVLSVSAVPETQSSSNRSRFAAQWADAIVDLFEQVRDPHVVATELGLSERSVRKFLTEEGLSYLALPAGKDSLEARRWSRDRILVAIRKAARSVGEPLSLSRFHQWAQSRGGDGPSERTIIVHFGSWRDACEAAGLTVWSTSREYLTSVTDEDCWGALTAYVHECMAAGQKPTMTGYERVSKDRGWPCRNSVTFRLGPWRTAVANIPIPD